VKLIAMGNTKFAKPKFAQNMDLSSCAEIAIGVAAFINNIWWIFDKLKDTKTSNPSIDDLKEEIERNNQIKEIPVIIRPALDEFLIEVVVHIKKNNL
jgi:hypothetical protein